MMYGYGTGTSWMMAFGLVVWVGVIAVAGWLLGRYLRSSSATPRLPSRETPLEILERRFAEGGMDVAEFDEARARIREDSH
jgi:putative membrane protein